MLAVLGAIFLALIILSLINPKFAGQVLDAIPLIFGMICLVAAFGLGYVALYSG